MPDEFQYDVFLSHSAKDKAMVRELAERLRTDGLKVWFDESVLKAGDSISAKVEEGLEQSPSASPLHVSESVRRGPGAVGSSRRSASYESGSVERSDFVTR